MKSQLYLHDYLRKFYISEIETFVRVFNLKLFPAFSDIDQEAEQLGQDYFDEVMNCLRFFRVPRVFLVEVLKQNVIVVSYPGNVLNRFIAASIAIG